MLGKRVLILVAGTIALSSVSMAATTVKTKATTTGKAATTAKTGGKLPGVVAIVNGEKITDAQLTEKVVDWQAPLVLDELITFAIVNQEAKKAGVVITPAQVDAKFEEMKKKSPGQDFAVMLRWKHGLTPGHASDFLKMQLQAEAVVKKTTKITPADLQGYRKISHILLLTRPADEKEREKKEAEAKTKIESIITESKGGASFADLAKKYSEDPGSKDKGGDVGWVTKASRMVPEFLTAAFALKNTGDMSEPVKSDYGYHILKLVAIGTDAKGVDKTDLEDQIIQQKVGSIQQWVQKLRDKAKINNIIEPAKPAPKPMPAPKLAAPAAKKAVPPAPKPPVAPSETPPPPPPPPAADTAAPPAPPAPPAAP